MNPTKLFFACGCFSCRLFVKKKSKEAKPERKWKQGEAGAPTARVNIDPAGAHVAVISERNKIFKLMTDVVDTYGKLEPSHRQQ